MYVCMYVCAQTPPRLLNLHMPNFAHRCVSYWAMLLSIFRDLYSRVKGTMGENIGKITFLWQFPSGLGCSLVVLHGQIGFWQIMPLCMVEHGGHHCKNIGLLGDSGLTKAIRPGGIRSSQ